MLKAFRRFLVQIYRIFHLSLCITCYLHKRSHHLLTQREKLIRMAVYKRIFPFIHFHGDHNLVANFQKFSQQPVLNRRETGKSIHCHNASL